MKKKITIAVAVVAAIGIAYAGKYAHMKKNGRIDFENNALKRGYKFDRNYMKKLATPIQVQCITAPCNAIEWTGVSKDEAVKGCACNPLNVFFA